RPWFPYFWKFRLRYGRIEKKGNGIAQDPKWDGPIQFRERDGSMVLYPLGVRSGKYGIIDIPVFPSAEHGGPIGLVELCIQFKTSWKVRVGQKGDPKGNELCDALPQFGFSGFPGIGRICDYGMGRKTSEQFNVVPFRIMGWQGCRRIFS